MKNWKYFWQNYRDVEIRNQEDLLYQVGKTVNGEVISQEQLKNDLNEIVSNLDLKQSDVILDLCCGNGVLSLLLSKSVKKIIGIDFSDTYIENAKIFSSNKNIEYFSMDILDFELLKKICNDNNITKILMNDCLAYFNPRTLGGLIKSLSQFKLQILLSSVLERKRKWDFYDSNLRKWNYIKDIIFFNKESGIGYWWKKSQIEAIAKENDFTCHFFNHHKDNHTSHYRFNVKLIKI